MPKVASYGCLLIVIAWATCPAAQQPKPEEGSQPEAQQPKTLKEMTPEEQRAIMEKMMALGKPGPEHEKLANMAGAWTLSATMWHVPGAPPHPGRQPAGCRFHPRCEYQTEICRTEPVVIERVGDRQAVRCHRHDELELSVSLERSNR